MAIDPHGEIMIDVQIEAVLDAFRRGGIEAAADVLAGDIAYGIFEKVGLQQDIEFRLQVINGQLCTEDGQPFRELLLPSQDKLDKIGREIPQLDPNYIREMLSIVDAIEQGIMRQAFIRSEEGGPYSGGYVFNRDPNNPNIINVKALLFEKQEDQLSHKDENRPCKERKDQLARFIESLEKAGFSDVQAFLDGRAVINSSAPLTEEMIASAEVAAGMKVSSHLSAADMKAHLKQKLIEEFSQYASDEFFLKQKLREGAQLQPQFMQKVFGVTFQDYDGRTLGAQYQALSEYFHNESVSPFGEVHSTQAPETAIHELPNGIFVTSREHTGNIFRLQETNISALNDRSFTDMTTFIREMPALPALMIHYAKENMKRAELSQRDHAMSEIRATYLGKRTNVLLKNHSPGKRSGRAEEREHSSRKTPEVTPGAEQLLPSRSVLRHAVPDLESDIRVLPERDVPPSENATPLPQSKRYDEEDPAEQVLAKEGRHDYDTEKEEFEDKTYQEVAFVDGESSADLEESVSQEELDSRSQQEKLEALFDRQLSVVEILSEESAVDAEMLPEGGEEQQQKDTGDLVIEVREEGVANERHDEMQNGEFQEALEEDFELVQEVNKVGEGVGELQEEEQELSQEESLEEESLEEEDMEEDGIDEEDMEEESVEVESMDLTSDTRPEVSEEIDEDEIVSDQEEEITEQELEALEEDGEIGTDQEREDEESPQSSVISEEFVVEIENEHRDSALEQRSARIAVLRELRELALEQELELEEFMRKHRKYKNTEFEIDFLIYRLLFALEMSDEVRAYLLRESGLTEQEIEALLELFLQEQEYLESSEATYKHLK